MKDHIHMEVVLPAAPERYYDLLINGAKFADVTGQPGKGGGAAGAYFELFGGCLYGRQIELKKNELVTQAWRFKVGVRGLLGRSLHAWLGRVIEVRECTQCGLGVARLSPAASAE